MTNGSWIAMSALTALMATAAVHADITTIDADPYASGTDVSTVFEGVTLSHLTWNGGAYQASAVHSVSCGTAPSAICNPVGFATFGWQTPTSTYSASWVSPGMSNVATCLVDPTQAFCSSPAQHILEVSFDTDTDFVQFNATYTNYAPDVLAFDAAGNVVTVTPQVSIVQTYTSGTALKLGHRVVTVTAPSANIKRLWIAGSGGNSSIDGISFGRPSTTCPVEASDMTTLEADPYAPGTDVSNVFEGVTLAHISWANGGFQSSAVHSAACPTSPLHATCNALGLASFGWLTPSSTVNRNWSSYSMATVQTCLTNPAHTLCASTSPPQNLLELSFDADTDYIQFDATYGNDNSGVLAFDAAGNVIAVTNQLTTLQNTSSSNSYGHQIRKITSATGNIRRLWIAGNGGYATINRISFHRTAPTCPIEEPSQ